MAEWSAEIDVDEALARRLLAAQFPELELGSLELVGEGWDNTVWRVDSRWAFRFPRRQIALSGIARELAVLPVLAPLLPLPVPDPVFVGRPGDVYPWPFFGCRFLPGHEPAEAGLDDDGRERLAQPLGGFLRTLHSLEADVELPDDPLRRADMSFRVPRTIEALAEVERRGLWRVPPEVGAILEEALTLPAPAATAIVHGDLHLRHLLVDDRGVLSAVLDWGDVCRSDPCVDLMLYWCLLSPTGRREFLSAYGPVSAEQLLRARVLALMICAVLAYSGQGSHVGEAVAGLDRTVR